MSLWAMKKDYRVIVNLDKTDAVVLVDNRIEFGSLIAPTGQVIPFFFKTEEAAMKAFDLILAHLDRAEWDETYKPSVLWLDE